MSSTPPPFHLTVDRLRGLTDRARGCRIAVIGDVMLDRYLAGDAERVSPEAPVPVVSVREARSRLGGAANVGANLTTLGATCLLVGVVGDDVNGAAVRGELATQLLDDRFLVEVAGRPTTTKTRVVARGQQVVRIDEEVETQLEGPSLDRLTWCALEAVGEADAVLLQDYNKGVLGPPLIAALIARARRRGLPVVVDPKFRHFFDYAGATVFKPNRRELERALGATADPGRQDLLAAALERLQVENLLLTLGGDGMLLVTRERAVTRIPSVRRSVYDVSGAGDTVTAWIGAMLAAGASMREAAVIANDAASVEVAKAGVATVTAAEVLAVHEERYDQIGRLRRGGVI